MLGAKGIGRFASSRLGTKTILKSIGLDSDNDPREVVFVQIDWDDFSETKYLDDIEIQIKREPLDLKDAISGVQLEITYLRDNWSKKRLETLIKELRRLVTPNNNSGSFKIYLDLEDFNVSDFGFDGPELLNSLNFDQLGKEAISENLSSDTNHKNLIVPFQLQNYSDYKLVGSFNAEGEFLGEFTNYKGDSVATPIKVGTPKLDSDEVPCGPVSIDINVYDRETESVEALFKRMGYLFDKIGVRLARHILTENAGIAIFRNDFRIRPYGEPENDWLELERKRVQDPSRKLGLSQVSGSVIIADEAKSGLIERSSREGLEHNGQFLRLKSLILGVMLHIEVRRRDFREKAGLSRKISGDVTHVKKIASLENVTSAVSTLPIQYQEPIQKAIDKEVSALTSSLEEMDEYQKLLQSRASLGLVVAQVIHEGRRILNPMSDTAKTILKNIDFLLENTKLGEVLRRNLPDNLKVILNGTNNMSQLFKKLDPVSGRKRGRPSDFSINKSIEASISLFSDTLEQNNIITDIALAPSITAHGYEQDFQAGVLNILENAIYWLNSSSQQTKTISIHTKVKTDSVEIYIENNGPLIDDDYVPRLFTSGFSLKSDGMGLGLSIGREACRASKGDLLFKEDNPNTCFVISFPK